MAMWGGRFEEDSDPLFRTFNDSLPFDYRLVHPEIRASRAWAAALARAGVLSGVEAEAIDKALGQIADGLTPDLAAVRDGGDEDIHGWVERELIARVDDLGKKLHTGRSRNDQVATDLRIWAREACRERQLEIRSARAALVTLAEREIDTVMPGYTHLQRAQPVLFAHWCLAYEEMLARDDARFADAARRANQCPLGAAALAGTAYPIDRDLLATDLEFDAPTSNSLDAISDRDFAIEALSAATICSIHLSRIAEDLIFFNSAEAGFIDLSDAMTSGSSLMPQKKNPDALELLRGKTGAMLGAFVALATTLKGLPLAYNKDLQEDKTPLFKTMDELSVCVRVLPRVLEGLTVRRDATRRASLQSYANATELADYLVGQGIPFRDAHDIVGRVVLRAIERGAALEELALPELQEFASSIGEDVYGHLDLDATLAKRDVIGGTAPRRVRAAIAAARERIGEQA